MPGISAVSRRSGAAGLLAAFGDALHDIGGHAHVELAQAK